LLALHVEYVQDGSNWDDPGRLEMSSTLEGNYVIQVTLEDVRYDYLKSVYLIEMTVLIPPNTAPYFKDDIEPFEDLMQN